MNIPEHARMTVFHAAGSAPQRISGRDLDAAIEENIFGHPCRKDALGCYCHAADGSYFPSYSGSLYGAAEVLSWMQVKGSGIELTWGEDTHAWECSWITGGRRYTGVGGTAATAICRCALRGVAMELARGHEE